MGHIGLMETGRWLFKPTGIWRRLVAVVGLAVFVAICTITLVAVVLIAAALGALLLEALVG